MAMASALLPIHYALWNGKFLLVIKEFHKSDPVGGFMIQPEFLNCNIEFIWNKYHLKISLCNVSETCKLRCENLHNSIWCLNNWQQTKYTIG